MKTHRRFFKKLLFRQLRALVEEFGKQLVDTQGQEVVLTEDGLLLVERAEPVV